MIVIRRTRNYTHETDNQYVPDPGGALNPKPPKPPRALNRAPLSEELLALEDKEQAKAGQQAPRDC